MFQDQSWYGHLFYFGMYNFQLHCVYKILDFQEGDNVVAMDANNVA
jgi:hypothetical protein